MRERLPKEILDAASQAEQVEYTIHYKAVLKAAKAYGDEPSSARKKIWEESKRSLSDQEAYLMEKYGQEQVPPESFATQQEVLIYLKAGGYKIEKSALSNHVRTRMLIKKQGVFRRQDVDGYAERHLQSGATGQTAADKKTAGLNERKLLADIGLTEEKHTKARIEREALEGKYILRADLELELASRAVVFDAALRTMIQGQAPGWIELVGGEQGKTPDLIEMMLIAAGDLLSDYATTARFQVVFKGNAEGEDGEYVAE